MKTLIKFSVFMILSFTAVVAIMNWDSFKIFAHSSKRMIEEKLNEAQTMSDKLSFLESKIEGLDREIYDLKTEVVRREVDVEYMDKIVKEKQISLIDLKNSLELASELLAKHRDYYVFSGRRYTFNEVGQDAAEKMKIFKIQEETLNNLKKTLDTKRKTLAIAEKNVAKGESLKGEVCAKVKFLKAQLERYSAKAVYAETIKSEDTGAEFKTLIGKTQNMLAEFEKQLEVKDRLLDERIRLGGEFMSGIDYTTESGAAPGEGDIAEEIVSYFNKGEKATVSDIAMDL